MAKDDTAPSDWLKTSVPSLAALDSALRCLICKDYLDTPMITSCAHTFCSICIRRHLATEGKCPFCRAADQPHKLKNNNAMEDVVTAFKRAKPEILQLDGSVRAGSKTTVVAGRKRKADAATAINESEASPRKTRSSARRTATPTQTPQQPIELADSEDDFETIEEERNDAEEEQPPAKSDGLVPCPICQRRMPEAAVYSHLDKCDGTAEQPAVVKSQPPKASFPLTSTSTNAPKSEPLAGLNYSMLNESVLRKKLDSLGIPASGNKATMTRRHTEWVNLWNANLDSRAPKSKRELLRDLETWERNQTKASTDTRGIMEKDFNGKAWADEHKSDFDDLIASARAKMKAAAEKNKQAEKESNATSDDSAKGETGVEINKAAPEGTGAELTAPSTAEV